MLSVSLLKVRVYAPVGVNKTLINVASIVVGKIVLLRLHRINGIKK